MKNFKAQIATEYIIIMGLVLVVTIPLLYYAMKESNISIQLNKAEDAVNTLARAADTVYSIGPGTRRYVWVNMPGGIEAYSTSNKTVLIRMYVFKGLSDVFAETKAELAGIIPISKGQHRVRVEMLESGYVQFGEGNDTAAPIVIWTSPQGTINYGGIVLRATTNEYSTCRYNEENDGDVMYSLMSGKFVGSALTHEKDIGFLADGNYAYYARCQDPDGNAMNKSAVINFTIVPISGAYEPYPPVVSLMSPVNNYIINGNDVLFEYIVTDNSSIFLCDLIIDDTIDQTNLDITRNITQNFTKIGIDYGNYTWNVNCSDVHGNRNSSLIRNLSINSTWDNDMPIVNLISPLNDTTSNYWLVRFSYNVTDETSGIDYCNLHMAGSMGEGEVRWITTHFPIEEGATESTVFPLFKANYTWSVSCIDDSYSANEGYSDTWYLEVNVTAGGEVFIESCAGWCGWQGLGGGGFCGQSASKCADNCGLPYDPTHDCYAGANVSETYCLAGPQANTCCCILA